MEFNGIVGSEGFSEESDSGLCQVKSSEFKQDACVTASGILLTKEALIVSGGINGGFIDIKNDDMRK